MPTPALPESTRAAAHLAIALSDWLDDRFTLPTPDVPTHEHPDPETTAEMVRARWNLGTRPAPNTVQLLESKGVRVFSAPAAAGSFSFWHNKTPYVFLDPSRPPLRARFDTARELGRLVHQDDTTAFAAAFLMPRKAITGAAPHQVRAQSTIWHVEPLALTYRLRDAGLLTGAQYRDLCTRVSTDPDTTRREASRLLPTVFRTLRQQGITPRQVARDLHVDIEELNGLVSGQVLTVVTPAARG